MPYGRNTSCIYFTMFARAASIPRRSCTSKLSVAVLWYGSIMCEYCPRRVKLMPSVEMPVALPSDSDNLTLLTPGGTRREALAKAALNMSRT